MRLFLKSGEPEFSASGPQLKRRTADAMDSFQAPGQAHPTSAEKDSQFSVLHPSGCESNNRYQKRNPDKWKHGLKPAVRWWLIFDPLFYCFPSFSLRPLEGKQLQTVQKHFGRGTCAASPWKFAVTAPLDAGTVPAAD